MSNILQISLIVSSCLLLFVSSKPFETEPDLMSFNVESKLDEELFPENQQLDDEVERNKRQIIVAPIGLGNE